MGPRGYELRHYRVFGEEIVTQDCNIKAWSDTIFTRGCCQQVQNKVFCLCKKILLRQYEISKRNMTGNLCRGFSGAVKGRARGQETWNRSDHLSRPFFMTMTMGRHASYHPGSLLELQSMILQRYQDLLRWIDLQEFIPLSMRPLGRGEYKFSWEWELILLFTSEGPGDIFILYASVSCEHQLLFTSYLLRGWIQASIHLILSNHIASLQPRIE